MREVIIRTLEREDRLPPLPEILYRLESLIKDPEAQLGHIARLIESEPVLAGKLMKLANSVFYGGGRLEVKTLNMAVGRLGLRMVHQLLLSIVLPNVFPRSEALDHYQFWQHSLAAAVLSRSFGKILGLEQEETEMAYLAGLLHDVGILIFATNVPEEYAMVKKQSSEEEKPLIQIEREHFGIDHAELGALFIERNWRIDGVVVKAVKMHHHPFNDENFGVRCAQLVSVANDICNSQNISNGISYYAELFKCGAWLKLGLTIEDIEDILEQVSQTIEETEALLAV